MPAQSQEETITDSLLQGLDQSLRTNHDVVTTVWKTTQKTSNQISFKDLDLDIYESSLSLDCGFVI